MGRNLNYQFQNSIERAFSGGGVDKHSLKFEQHTGRQSIVYSYAERKSLINLTHLITDFTKKNYPEVKLIKDIKLNVIQEFLNSKASDCSKATLGLYTSLLNKVEGIVNANYKENKVEWYRDLITPASEKGQDKIRDIAMDKTEYDAIIKRGYDMETKSKAFIALETAGRFAMRVCETCTIEARDVNMERMMLHIHESKGGRSRDVKIKTEDKPFLQRITFGKDPTERICNIKEDSVNKYLERAESALGFREKFKDSCTGVQSIRKMVAQQIYDKYRASGLTQKQSLTATSIYLGHGENRDETMKQYVLNIH